jgi:hypothetical protein
MKRCGSLGIILSSSRVIVGLNVEFLVRNWLGHSVLVYVNSYCRWLYSLIFAGGHVMFSGATH